MNAEPSQLIRGMDVDIGMGLGDDLGGFEGFDTMFAEPNNTTDFFNLCALDEQEQDAATTSALSSPPSLVDSFGQQQRGHDFAQDSWNTAAVVAQQQQIQAWPSLTLSSSEPTRNPNVLLQGGGKPRVRKRHDEDEALEAAEEAFPVLKRRSSTASMTMNAGSAPTSEGLEKSHSFCVTTASRGWTPAVTQQPQGTARHGGQQPPQHGGVASPLGGAIKVKTDVTSGTMRPPRISVFMSSSARRSGASASQGVWGSSPSVAANTALPGSCGQSCQHQLEPTMDRTASAQAQRLKGLRITMRGRSMAEKYVVEHNPAVVAMGSPHHPNSTSALLLGDHEKVAAEGRYAVAAAPTLRRASSVGALTISGNGEVLSTSPVLSATGTIIQSCELSDRVGDGSRRRNLVCKVFGFGSGGSPYMGSTNNGGR